MLSDQCRRIAPLSVSDNSSGAFSFHSVVPGLSGRSTRTEFIAARAKQTSAMLEHLSDELTPPSQLPQRSFWRPLLDLTAFPASRRALKGLQSVLCTYFLFPRPSLKLSVTGSYQGNTTAVLYIYWNRYKRILEYIVQCVSLLNHHS